MKRGLAPRPPGPRLLGVWIVIATAAIGGSSVAHAQPTPDRTGEGLGAFERPAEGSDPRAVDAGDASGVASPAPGLRRNGERSFRRDAAETRSSSTGGRLLRTILWLGLVVGLAVGTLHLVRRFMPGSVPPQNRNLVRVLGRGTLGPKHQVVVTQVGGQILILGVAGDSIVRLGEVSDPEEAVRLVPREDTFTGTIDATDRKFAEEVVYPEGHADWSPPAEEEPADERLEPYRREVARLQSMVELWQRQDRLDERGSA